MYWANSLLLAALPLAISQPTYKIPKEFTKSLLATASCKLPEGFLVKNFQAWTPARGNNASSTVQFGYADNSTSIQTSCRYNSTSPNVGKPGLASRYACDDPLVEFIWNNGTLTVIETACPGKTGSRGFEASGSAKLKIECVATGGGFQSGRGTQCLALNKNLEGRFASLQPSPPR